MVLIGLIPLIGAIVLIVFACIDSGPPNKYGPGPDDRGELVATAPVDQAPPPAPQSPPSSETPPPSEGGPAS